MESFKVICLEVPKEWRLYKSFFNYEHPEVLDECVVVEILAHPIKGNPMYRLSGYAPNVAFAARWFATLPKATATEMYEQEFEAIIK